MNRFNSRTVLGLAVAFALASGTASATNGYFSGIGTKGKGLAGAGSADPGEILAIATNPAGLALLPETVDAGLGFFSPSRKYKTSESLLNGNCFVPPGSETPFCPFTIGPNNLQSENEIFPVPYAAMNWKLNDQNALAVAFYGRGGMNTQWQGGTATFDPDGYCPPESPAGTPGCFYGPTTFRGTYGGGSPVALPGDPAQSGDAGVDLAQVFLNTTYAWKTADDQFAVGVSAIFAMQLFQARGVGAFAPYTKTFVESYNPQTGMGTMPKHLSGNGHESSYGFGGSVGGIWNINKMFSVAAAYTSKIFMSKLNDYSDLFAENGGFDIPATATLGLTVRPTDQWAASFDYQTIWYSDIPSVGNPIQKIYNCPTAGGSKPQSCLGGNNGAGFGWKDMDIYKVGLAWQYDDAWTFRVGFSVPDSQPIPKSQMTFNILAPGVVEQHYTAGFTHRMEGGNELSLSLMYAPTVSVKGPNNFDPTQTVEFSMHQFDLELGYSWGR
jgi:long-chain fatty acid transport protein